MKVVIYFSATEVYVCVTPANQGIPRVGLTPAEQGIPGIGAPHPPASGGTSFGEWRAPLPCTSFSHSTNYVFTFINIGI
jgi:hypothetical protein